MVDAIIDSLLEKVPVNAPFDLMSGSAYPLPIMIVADLLALPPEDHPPFQRWSTTLSKATAIQRSDSLQAEILETRTALRDYFGHHPRAPQPARG